MTHLYRSFTESTLPFSLICWHGDLSVKVEVSNEILGARKVNSLTYEIDMWG